MKMPDGLDIGDCPRCHRALPALPFALTSRYEDGYLNVTLVPESMTAYKARVRLTHPWCFGGQDDVPTEAAA